MNKMPIFRGRPLRQQLIIVNVAATGAALIVAFTLIFISSLRSRADGLVRDLTIKADIVGNQCAAALTFGEPKDAEEILGALRADPQIETASVYTEHGRLFAAYTGRSPRGPFPASPPAPGHVFGLDHLVLTRPIMLHNEHIGTITIRSSLAQFHALLVTYTLGTALVLMLSLTAASVLLSRLQRSVSKPVSDLARLMEKVSRDKDYSRRADADGPRELVSLAASFNDMLTAIQNRDRELERSLAELKDAYGRLEKLDSLKSDFISTVSHELRTPLTSIKAFVEILLAKPNVTDERRKHFLDIINTDSDRLARLISDLLDISRIESGVLQWRDEETSITDTVLAALSRVALLAENKNITIRARTEEGLPRIPIDRDRLMQVIMNLLSNALKFTPAGGSITIETARQALPDSVAVAVSDTGVGIPAGDLGRIFEKFQRSGEVLTNTIEGTGLGLTISRQIIEHYGGRLWAESEAGKGSVFTFFLPLDRRDAAGRETRRPARGRDYA